MKLWQRLSGTIQTDIGLLGEFIKSVKLSPGSCEGVWLASLYGFPSLETHRKHAETLKKSAALLRENGIDVALQISNTIGHGEYMQSRDNSALVYDGSPVQCVVGSDGTQAKYCFCWNGDLFCSYMREVMRIYAEIKPSIVWIDDDLRPGNHAPVDFGCFCECCVARFNEDYGCNYSREELVHEINFGDISTRANFIEFTRKGLYNFTYMISKELCSVSPDTELGFQCYCHGSYLGFGLDYIFSAMRDASGKPPHSRPGGGAYDDRNPGVFIDKAVSLSWQNYMLPDYVSDICPEIESLPDVMFGKSIAGTCFETSCYLAFGGTDMSYAIMQNENEPMTWHAKMLSAFSDCRDYWQRLSSVNKATHQSGLYGAIAHEIWRSRHSEEFAYNREPYDKMFALGRVSVPIAFSRDGDVFILVSEMTENMTDAEITELLKKPVLTDGRSLEILAQRGFDLGIKPVKSEVARFYEKYIEGVMDGKRWGTAFSEKYGYYFETADGKAEPMAYYGTDSKEPLGDISGKISATIATTPFGARWAVYGYCPWANTISSSKRHQLLDAVDRISGDALAAYLETPLPSVVLPRVTSDGRTAAVSIINTTVGKSGKLVLRLRRPVSEQFEFMCAGKSAVRLTYERDNDDYLVNVPEIDSWSVASVFSCQ